MTFVDLLAGDAVFLDANTFIASLVVAATGVSQQTGLLTNDALMMALMQANGLTKLASNDTDLDRVPGLTRYAPG
jgi:predicted nucleic acid-binding protein